MKYTMKKTIAFLLTLVMLVNILPVSVLAEQPEEGRRGPLNAPATRGNGHTAEVSVEDGVNTDYLYIVFIQQFTVPGWGDSLHDYVYISQYNGASTYTCTNLTCADNQSVEHQYDSNSDTFVYLWKGDQYNQNPTSAKPDPKIENNSTYPASSYSVSIITSGDKTTITIGEVTTEEVPHTASIGIQNNGGPTPEIKIVADKYCVVAKVNDVAYYALVSEDGTVGNFCSGLGNETEDGKIPDIADKDSVKIVEYESGKSAEELAAKAKLTEIQRGGPQGPGGPEYYTLTGPELDEETNDYHFTLAEKKECKVTLTNASELDLEYLYVLAKVGDTPVAYADLSDVDGTERTELGFTYGTQQNKLYNNTTLEIVYYSDNNVSLENLNASSEKLDTNDGILDDIHFEWNSEPTTPTTPPDPQNPPDRYNIIATQPESYTATLTFDPAENVVLNGDYYVLIKDGNDHYKYYAPVSTNGLGSFTKANGKMASYLVDVASIAFVKAEGTVAGINDLTSLDPIIDGGTIGEYYTVEIPPADENNVYKLKATKQENTYFMRYDNVSEGFTLETDKHYYLLALIGDMPAFYAALPGQTNTDEPIEFTNANGTGNNTVLPNVTFQLMSTESEANLTNISAGTDENDLIVANDDTKFNLNYEGIHRRSANEHDIVATRVSTENCVVIDFMDGGEPDLSASMEEGYYLIIQAGESYYYAPITVSGPTAVLNNYTKAGTTETISEIDQNSIRYWYIAKDKGGNRPLTERINTLIRQYHESTLDSQNANPGIKVGSYSFDEFSTIKGADNNFHVTANKLPGYEVTVNFVDRLQENPVVPGQEDAPEITDSSWILAEMYDQSDTLVAYAVKKIPTNASSNTILLDTFKMVTYINPSNYQDGNTITYEQAKAQGYYVNTARLAHKQDGNNPNNYNEAKQMDQGDYPGYTFVSNRLDNYVNESNKGDPKTAKSSTITIRESNPSIYNVQINSGDSPIELPDDVDIYALVTVTNSDGTKRYNYAKVDSVSPDGGYTYTVQLPGDNWWLQIGYETYSQYEDNISGHEQNVEISLAVVEKNAVIRGPQSLISEQPRQNRKLPEGSGIQTHILTQYTNIPKDYNPSAETGKAKRIIDDDPGVLTTITDILYLDKNEDSFNLYSIEKLLNGGYNVITLCDGENGDSGFTTDVGQGDAYIANHQMGGLLIRGDLVFPAEGFADSEDADNPSVVGGLISGITQTAIVVNNRHNNDDYVPFYMGSLNTVAGDYVNGTRYGDEHDRVWHGFNYSGPTIVNDDYVDWVRLQRTARNASSALIDNTEPEHVQPENGIVNIYPGQNVIVDISAGEAITVNILGTDEELGYWVNGKFKPRDDLPGTVINFTGTGDMRIPELTLNGHILDTDETGRGISIVYNYPYCTGTITKSGMPEFGHVIAPRAFVHFGSGNYSGTVICNNAYIEAGAEGHLYPYKGGDLVGFYGEIDLSKKVKDSEESTDLSDPTARQKYYFNLKQLRNKLTTSDYNELVDTLETTNNNIIFWEDLQSVSNEGSTVKFEDVSFTHDGVYYFLISEDQTKGLKEGETRDNTVYLISCTVKRRYDGDKTVFFIDSNDSESLKYYKVIDEENLISITDWEIGIGDDGPVVIGKTADVNFDAVEPIAGSIVWNPNTGKIDTDITYINTDEGTETGVILTGTKTLEGSDLTNNQFSFKVVTDPEDPDEEPVATGKNNAQGTITFTPKLKYTSELFDDIEENEIIYTYYVLEVIPEDAETDPVSGKPIKDSIIYDNSIKTIKVKVTYVEGTGEVLAELLDDESDDIEFVNEALGKLTINKDFAGNAANDLTDEQKAKLEFTVAGIAETATAGYSETFKYSVNDANRNATWSGNTLTITKLKLGNYTVSESGDTFTDANGNAYIHSVEMKVGATETSTVEATVAGGTIDLTNTYDKAELTVTKSFGDSDLTPEQKENIVFKVTGNGLKKDGATVSELTKKYSEMTNDQWILTQADGIMNGVTYTVSETADSVEIPGYNRTTTVQVNNGTAKKQLSDTITITDGTGTVAFVNTYTQETVEVEVDKAWLNADGSKTWPDGVTVGIQLTADNSPVTGKTANLNKDNPSYTFESLPKYQADGKTEIAYSVKEVEVPGYESEVGELTNGKITVTNTQETVEVEVNKAWLNADGSKTWPEGVTVGIQLTADNSPVTGKTANLNKDNPSYTFESLPKYQADGKTEIAYSVEEVEVPGYESEVGELTNGKITVTNTQETVEVEVDKAWLNADGSKTWPEGVTVGIQLTADNSPVTGKTANLNKDNPSYTFESLPKYQTDGKTEIAYSVEEVEVPGYESEVGELTNGKITVTNTQETVEVEVDKAWLNADGSKTWPDGVTVGIQLTADNSPVTGKTANLNKDNPSYTFESLPKYQADGKTEIAYSVKEVEVPGYESEVGELTNGKITVTNTQETVEVEVNKAWLNADGSKTWPEGVTVGIQLTADNSPVTGKTANLNKDNPSYTFESLPKYQADGKTEIAYSVKEVEVPGYESEVGELTNGKITVTNTQETVEVEVDKAWLNADGSKTWPDGVTVGIQLTADNSPVTGKTANLDKDNPSYTFESLPKYQADGKTEIAYSVKEVEVPGYESEVGELTNGKITVTNTQETVEVEVDKAWLNADGSKTWPEGVTVGIQLTADNSPVTGKTANLNKDNPSYTFESLPKYQTDGKTEIAYSVEEVEVPGYESEVGELTNGKITVTNTQETVEVEVDKAWLNADGSKTWPEGVTVGIQLTADNSPVTGKTANLNKDNPSYTFESLPKYQADGKTEIAYSVEEVEVPGYGSEVGELTNGKITVTNTQETVEVEVDKAWLNADGSKTWPDGVTVGIQLTADNSPVTGKTANLDKDNPSYTFESLPKYQADGKTEIAYSVEEVEVPGYESEVGELTNGKITVTNTQETVEVEVDKAWLNADGSKTWPDGVTVGIQLTADNSPVTGKTANLDKDNPSYTFESLPKYQADGKTEIAYSVEEVEVPGYESEVGELTNGKITVTNTQETVEVEVDKAWLNADGSKTWPDGMTVGIQLTADNSPVTGKTANLDKDNPSYTFESLPKYQADGKTEIAYSVEEVEVPGYESEVGELTNGKITVTNTQETVEVEVDKAWLNADGSKTWPDGVTVGIQLTADNSPVTGKTANLNKDNPSYTFESLPKYQADGKTEIAYSVEEVEVPGYESEVGELTNGKITVTNTQETVEVEVDKAWLNADGSKTWPDGVTVGIQLTADNSPVTGKTANLDKDNPSYTFESLPKYQADGKTEIAYSVEEVEVPGYESEVGELTNGKITITNKQGVVDITVDKAWLNADGSKTWPDGVTVGIQLTADNSPVTGKTANLNKDNPSYTFESLPKYQADGKTEIAYSVEEVEVPGYGSEVGELTNGKITVTNTQETVEVEVDKAWLNADGSKTWPEGVTVGIQLTADNSPVTGKTANLNKDNPSYTFESLPKYQADGKTEIAYSVEEVEVPGYESEVGELTNGKITVTNTQETVEVEVDKAWLNADGSKTWPDGVTVGIQLTADNSPVTGKTANLDKDNPSYTFESLPKYQADGKTEIAYSVEEVEVPGYESEVGELTNGKITVTNTQETVEVEVDKAWLNADGSKTWPDGMTVGIQLTADNSPVTGKTANLDKDNPSYTFESLPKYQADGKTEIAYSVEEVEVPGYESEVGELTNGKITVTNTQETVEVEVDKAWLNADGSKTWPDGVTVGIQLTADNSPVTGKTANLDKDNPSYTFESLPKYQADGKTEIAYSVEEVEVPGYESEVGELTNGKITVTNTQETVEVEVDKAWLNADGSKTWPDGVTVGIQLTADNSPVTGKTANLDKDNPSYTFESLPKYQADGKTEIAYSVKEVEVPGYESEVGELTNGKITVTNTQETVEVEVDKAWLNADGSKTWPEGVTVGIQLTADNSPVTGKTANLNKDNPSYTFESLPKYQADGKTEIAYSVKEVEVPGYESEVGELTNGKITVTNTQETVEVEVDKAWLNADGSKTWPEGVTVGIQLTADNSPVTGKTANLNKDNPSYTFESLPKYQTDGKTEIAYSVEEVEVPGYESEVGELTNGKITVTNTQETVEVEVNKAWLNADGSKTWPDGVTVGIQLTADNSPVTGKTANLDKDNPSYTFESLPKYQADGKTEIAYSVEEVEVPGYESEVGELTNGKITVTNTQETVEVEVDKAWLNADGSKTWPDGVTVGIQLTADNSPVTGKTANLDKDNPSYTFESLPKYQADGKTEIAYSVEEVEVPGYESEVGELTNGKITVTNTQETVEVEVDKAWLNADGSKTWPDGVTVGIQLTADNSPVTGKTANLDKDNPSYTFESLPKYQADGKTEIAYSVKEVEVPGYESEVGELTNGKITVTNTQETVEVEVDKAWLNADGSKTWPEGVTVGIQLTADNSPVTGKTANLDKDNPSYTFESLPKYQADGKTEIAYSVEEVEVPGYESEVGELTNGKITVTNTQETVEVEVDKAWLNADGSKTWPDGVTVGIQLTADNSPVTGKTANLDKDNPSYTFESLPKYQADGKTEIAYSVEEVEVPGYESEVGELTNGKITVTNTQETVEVEVDKAWLNADGSKTWPDGVTVGIQLTADNSPVTGKTANLDKDNPSYTFESLPKYQADGKTEIAYSVEEVEVPGYESEVGELTNGKITVTNTQETVEVEVDKAWLNAGGSDTWPTGVTVDIHLTADGNAVSGKTAQLSASKTSHKFTDLPKYQADGTTEIAYSVEEVEVPGYESEVGELTNGKITVTNTQETVEVEVEKTWLNAGGSDTWPTGVTVDIQLTADGNAVSGKTAQLSASKTSHKFTDLPKYQADGTTEIAYSVEEVEVPGYESEVGELTNGKITVTNTQETVEVEVEKTWLNAGGSDTWPTGVTVDIQLTADGNAVSGKTAQLSASKTSHKFTDLPKYQADGTTEIAYSVEEVEVPGYESEVGELTNGKITVTNTQDVGSVKVTKIFEGITELPEGFRITNDYNKDEFTALNADAGDGIAVPFEWVIENVPVETVITFTESGAEVEGFNLTAISAASKVSDAVVVDDTVTVEFTNTYERKTGTAAPEITKKMAGEDAKEAPDGVYVFKLTPVGDAPMPESDEVSVSLKKGETEGKAAFGEITYDTAGTYTYEIAEVPGDTPGMKYADGKVTVTVTVTEDATELTTVVAYKDGLQSLTNTYKKPDKPSFEKKIQDINDTTGETSGWQDSADYDIGDSVPYKLTAVLANNVTDYLQYHVTFHDKMEKGLTFEEIQKVEVNGEALPENGYVLKKISDQEFSLTVTFNDGKSKITNTALNNGTVEVYFTAILNENAVIGGHGNVNTGKLEYSCNPNVDENGKQNEDTEETEEDSVICFTYKVDVNKVDPDGKALAGAAFNLEKKLKDGTLKLIKCVTASEGTAFSFTGLDDGEYILTETLAPEGYKGIEPITFKVTAEHEVIWTEAEKRDNVLTKLTGDVPSGELVFTADSGNGSLTADVENDTIANVSAAVKKVWKDEENRDGLRPTGLKIELLADGVGTGNFVTLNDENNWTGMLTGLAKYKDGKEIEYSWKEPTVVGYTLTGTVASGALTTLTNTHEADKTVVEVKKVWVDSGKHPEDVEVQLFADGKALGDTVKLNAGNGWKYSWTNLCRNVREAGVVREIKYTVAETRIPEGYVAKITGNASTGFVITNTKDTGKLIIEKEFDIQVPEEEPEEEEMLTEIEVVKIWDDNDNKDGNRPNSITVHLLAGGEEIKTAELTAANGWKRKFGDLPKFVNGHPIHYSVTEDPVPWYVSEIHGFTIRNRYQPELTSVSVRKVWNDENNKHLNRPVSVHMTLSNGMRVVLNEENGWMATITGLPTKVNGQPAVYTWTEQEVIGYELESMKSEGTVTVFTNRPWQRPDKPTEGKPPRLPGEEIYIEEYETPLGVEVIINHVGDCFD